VSRPSARDEPLAVEYPRHRPPSEAVEDQQDGDPAIMVGIGWTPNLGNSKACLLYGGILAAIITLAVVRAVVGT
jgi:hypothetical protein